jgi:hypothetical protein
MDTGKRYMRVHNLNGTCTGTTELERWIRENDTSGTTDQGITVFEFIFIAILGITHRSDFYLNHDVSETGYCLRLQVSPAQFDSIDRANLCFRAASIYLSNRVCTTWRPKYNRVSETSCSEWNKHKNKIKDRTMGNDQNCDSYIDIPASQTYRSQ